MWKRKPSQSGNESGKDYERIAERWLNRQGLKSIQRNFLCRSGEIDLVMQQNNTLIFVEVRYRANHQYGGPLASVDPKKQQRLWNTATVYLSDNPIYQSFNVRIDVLGISPENSLPGKLRFDWIPNAINL